jgi:hypothetical protein
MRRSWLISRYARRSRVSSPGSLKIVSNEAVGTCLLRSLKKAASDHAP